jgi:hypothetical protein
VPPGRVPCRAPTRGGTFFAWPAQALQHAAPRGHADPYTCLGSNTCPELLQRRIRMIAHEALDDGMSGRVQTGFLAAGVGLRRNVPGGAVLTPHLLHKRETHAEYVSNKALGAESPLAGAEDLLTQINRVSSHTTQAMVGFSYDQVKTALEGGTCTLMEN